LLQTLLQLHSLATTKTKKNLKNSVQEDAVDFDSQKDQNSTFSPTDSFVGGGYKSLNLILSFSLFSQVLGCNPGEYVVRTNFCQVCSWGSYCPDGVSTYICPAGSYCPSGSKNPVGCPAGYYYPGALTGKWALSDCITQTICPAGHYCPPGTVTPLDCPAGYFYGSSTGKISAANCTAVVCSEGYYCPTDGTATTPIICPAAHYCPSGSATPLDCPAGYFYGSYTGKRSLQDCVETQFICRPGYYCPNESKPEKICSQGYYCPSEGITTPLICPAAYYCPSGTITPVACPAGYFYGSSTGKMSQNDCTATGEICPAGYYCPAGSITLNLCPEGTYSFEQGSLSCEKCPSGTYSSTKGNLWPNTCQKCPKGSYANGGGSSICTQCPEGTYSDEEGSSQCKACPSGFMSSSSRIGCTDCPATTYRDRRSNGQCLAITSTLDNEVDDDALRNSIGIPIPINIKDALLEMTPERKGRLTTVLSDDQLRSLGPQDLERLARGNFSQNIDVITNLVLKSRKLLFSEPLFQTSFTAKYLNQYVYPTCHPNGRNVELFNLSIALSDPSINVEELTSRFVACVWKNGANITQFLNFLPLQ